MPIAFALHIGFIFLTLISNYFSAIIYKYKNYKIPNKQDYNNALFYVDSIDILYIYTDYSIK